VPVLGLDGGVVALGLRGLETTEVGLDRRRVLTVLGALAESPLIALDLRGDVGHNTKKPRVPHGGGVL
jgi:hypothetical protein